MSATSRRSSSSGWSSSGGAIGALDAPVLPASTGTMTTGGTEGSSRTAKRTRGTASG
ncbi:hypothetical protein ACFQV2_26430 [Actinokineospora soli]|uniref:Uncharacterized protein n=1 Tax=Actinokineospora soli TaxID=1048753 RepID=A0ABW2TRM5_9PSEU